MKTPLVKCLAGLLIVFFLTSCADSKIFKIDNKNVVVEPYGWFDLEGKNDSIQYKVNTGNVVWSVILSETVIAPIVITGTALWEPVKKNETKKQ